MYLVQLYTPTLFLSNWFWIETGLDTAEAEMRFPLCSASKWRARDAKEAETDFYKKKQIAS